MARGREKRAHDLVNTLSNAGRINADILDAVFLGQLRIAPACVAKSMPFH